MSLPQKFNRSRYYLEKVLQFCLAKKDKNYKIPDAFNVFVYIHWGAFVKHVLKYPSSFLLCHFEMM